MSRRVGKFLTIGSFDGVHRGHQALFSLARKEAEKRKLSSLAITFKVPPRVVLNQDPHMMILSDPIEKEILIRRQGVNEVETLTFGKKISQLKPFAFFRDQLMTRFKAKGIVIGNDFRFGEGRSAGALELVRWGQEYEIPVWVVPSVRWNKKVVSSSLIRQLFETNSFTKALNFLGHPYLICGRVIKGRGKGSQLGFPTANIQCSKGKCLPRGVFVVKVNVASTKAGMVNGKKIKHFNGVCNIGYRPTYGRSHRLSVEAHLFGKPALLTGKFAAVELLNRIRQEKKFRSFKDLSRAIQNDVVFAKRFLAAQG